MTYLAAEKLRKGPWLEEEDEKLSTFVNLLGDRKWDYLARTSGLKRSGKSCRLRWMNYLRPNLKHGHISAEEEQVILQLHRQWGNKWSRIARRLPGRTDNEVKNYWRSHLKKKAQVEEDKFQCQKDNAKHDCLHQKDDKTASAKKYEDEEHRSVKELMGTTGNSFDVLQLSDSAFLSSPYETRLSDWISELSNNLSMEYQGDCSSVESCFCYGKSEYSETSMWDCSGSLWDII